MSRFLKQIAPQTRLRSAYTQVNIYRIRAQSRVKWISMDLFVKEAAHFVALIAESVAILIILLGVIKTVVFYLRSPLPSRFVPEIFLTLRVQLGGALSLSLEFLIGADILKSAISPSWNEIGTLAAVVVIRTFLNYFLMQELHSEIEKVK